MANDEWTTPREVWEPGLKAVGKASYDFDPYPSPNSTVPRLMGSPCDGHEAEWLGPRGKHVVWANPPYSRGNLGRAAKAFARSACRLARLGSSGVVFFLVPLDHTEWWRTAYDRSEAVLVPPKRIRFEDRGRPGPSPRAPSTLFVAAEVRSRIDAIRQQYEAAGWIAIKP